MDGNFNNLVSNFRKDVQVAAMPFWNRYICGRYDPCRYFNRGLEIEFSVCIGGKRMFFSFRVFSEKRKEDA